MAKNKLWLASIHRFDIDSGGVKKDIGFATIQIIILLCLGAYFDDFFFFWTWNISKRLTHPICLISFNAIQCMDINSINSHRVKEIPKNKSREIKRFELTKKKNKIRFTNRNRTETLDDWRLWKWFLYFVMIKEFIFHLIISFFSLPFFRSLLTDYARCICVHFISINSLFSISSNSSKLIVQLIANREQQQQQWKKTSNKLQSKSWFDLRIKSVCINFKCKDTHKGDQMACDKIENTMIANLRFNMAEKRGRERMTRKETVWLKSTKCDKSK